jgi:hypothetical protein
VCVDRGENAINGKEILSCLLAHDQVRKSKVLLTKKKELSAFCKRRNVGELGIRVGIVSPALEAIELMYVSGYKNFTLLRAKKKLIITMYVWHRLQGLLC